MTRNGTDTETRPSHGRGLPIAPRRSPTPPDPFEFVHVVGSDMCAAEDIFHRGQLLPFKPHPSSPASFPAQTLHSPRTAHHGREHRRSSSVHEGLPVRHRRSESLDGYERSRRRDGAASRYWKGKGSLSADYRRLRPVAEEACDAGPGKRAGPGSPRPKWYVLAFGSVRVPAEMDMRNIRGRLTRRSTSPAADSGGGSSCGVRAASGGGAWKLLRSLSCTGDVGGVVEAPLRLGLA